MQRSAIWCVVGLTAALGAACNRSGESRIETRAVVGDERGRPQLITAEGCLTASGDRFVLTALEAEEGSAEAYRLVGRDEELRAHVGRRIEVSGESEPEQVVDVRQSTEGRRPSPTGTSGATPQVDTTTTARIEVHDLRVRTIETTDTPCTASAD